MRNLLQRPLVLIARIYRRFRRQCAADASITGINDFPTELLFEIIIYLPLPALIAARTVNKRWRELIAVAPISPSRRRLLDLYIYAIASPSFLAMRAQIIPNLGPFDRKAYVARLEQQTGQHLPEDFRTWVLEWPARAVINWLWPGLSSRRRWSRARVGNSLKEGKVEMCTLQEGLPFYPSRPIYYVRKCDSDGAPQTKHWVYRMYVRSRTYSLDDLDIPDTVDIYLAGGGAGENMIGHVHLVAPLYHDEPITLGWVEFLRRELGH